MKRPAATTGNQSLPASAGAHGGTRANYEIIRMPSGSIAQIPALKEIDLAQARFHRAIMFALPISLALWGLICFAVWLLFFSGF